MKYCIGCIQLWFEPGQPGEYGSTWTGKYADTEQGEFACRKGHWRRRLDEHSSSPIRPKDLGEDITYELQKRMEQAETCEDFVEREIPESYRV